jgi:hypothetical protein
MLNCCVWGLYTRGFVKRYVIFSTHTPLFLQKPSVILRQAICCVFFSKYFCVKTTWLGISARQALFWTQCHWYSLFLHNNFGFEAAWAFCCNVRKSANFFSLLLLFSNVSSRCSKMSFENTLISFYAFYFLRLVKEVVYVLELAPANPS